MLPIRLVIVEHRTLFRQGLVALLHTEPDLSIVGEAASEDEAWQLCTRTHPDLILLSLPLPPENASMGVPLPERLRAFCPPAAILVLDEHGHGLDRFTAEESNLAGHTDRRWALQAGMVAHVSSDVDQTELIRRVHSLVAALGSEEHTGSASTHKSGSASPTSSITERERAVIVLVAQGLCNKEIAARLAISTQTVKNHVSHLLEKLALDDRTQLAVFALEQGVVPHIGGRD